MTKSARMAVKFLFGASIVSLFDGNTPTLLILVEGASSSSDILVCLPDAPDICSGTTYTATPSPDECAPEDESECSYIWGYSFVENLPQGTNKTSWMLDPLAEYYTGPGVGVRLEDNMINCTISVNDKECATCSVCNHDATSEESHMFSANCTNIESGRMVDCEPVSPIFYPLMIPGLTDESEGTIPSAFPPQDEESSNGTQSGAAFSFSGYTRFCFGAATFTSAGLMMF